MLGDLIIYCCRIDGLDEFVENKWVPESEGGIGSKTEA